MTLHFLTQIVHTRIIQWVANGPPCTTSSGAPDRSDPYIDLNWRWPPNLKRAAYQWWPRSWTLWGDAFHLFHCQSFSGKHLTFLIHVSSASAWLWSGPSRMSGSVLAELGSILTPKTGRGANPSAMDFDDLDEAAGVFKLPPGT